MQASHRRVDAVQIDPVHPPQALSPAPGPSELLANIGKELASSLKLRELLDRLARAVIPAFADWCVVDVVESDYQQLVAVAHVDPHKEQLARELQEGFPPMSSESSPMRHVLESGEPRYIRDYTLEMAAPDGVTDQLLHLMKQLGPESIISVPLGGRRGPMGVMSFLCSDSGRRFGPEDVTLAQEVASRAALAIENAQLFEAEQRARREAERLQALSQQLGQNLAAEVVLDQIAATAAELLASPVAGVFLLDANGEHFDLVAGRGLDLSAGLQLPRDRSLAGQLIDSGKATAISDAREAPVTALPQLVSGEAVGSLVVAPIISRSGPLGAVEVYSTTVGAFHQHEADLLAALAGSAAAVLENARLYRDRELDLARLYTMVEQLPVGIVVADCPSREISLKNGLADQLLGVDAKTLQPGTAEPRRGFHPDGKEYAPDEWPLARALTQGEVVSNERIEIRRPDGLSSYVSINAAPIRDSEGRIAGAVAIFEDVSGEEELRRQKEQFMAAAAHDLKTPLTSIRGLSQLLERQVGQTALANSERISTTLNGIASGTRKMTSLIEELLDLFQIESMSDLALNRTETELVDLVRAVVDMHSPNAPLHRIDLTASAERIVGQWDAARLERALSNLIGNAIKYSPDGSQICVSVSTEATDQGELATVSVSDHGIGIPTDELQRIFDRFQRGSNVPPGLSGSGVGLAYVRQVVVQHGGRIDVDSSPGKGATFTVRLPREDA